MAISFANAVGNLFNRLGKLGLVISQLRSYQNSQNTNMTNTTTGVVAQFNGESDIQALMGSAYIGELNSPGGIGQTMRSIAEATINRMVYRDAPRIFQTLTSTNLEDSIKEVIRQMEVAGASVRAQTITLTNGAFTGTGNGIINSSSRRPLDGLVQENAFDEAVLFTCTSDSYIGGATAGQEGFSVTGEGQQSDLFAFDWPLGSDASTFVSAIDGGSDNSGGNLLTNSDFETFSANVPSNWTLVTGAGGTNVFEETSIVFDGSKSLRITGDGSSTLTSLTQTFDNSSFTSGVLDELLQYSFNVWVRRDGTAAAAGVLTIDLIDGNNVVVNDANGTANSFTIDLTALTTSFVSYTGVFRTPAILATTNKIRMRLTTALTNGRSVYIDRASLGEMTLLYTGGPYTAVHSGAANFVQGDYGTLTVANSRGAAGTLDTFHTLIDRLVGLRERDLLLPSSSTPTISDSALIA